MFGYYILILLIGFIAGIMLMSAISINRFNEMEDIAYRSKKALNQAEKTILNQAEKIENLERNLEFVTNNLTPNKKKYIGLK